jgi:CDP-glycerol glycerophosphotransferase
MKIDVRNARHWAYLSLTATWALVAIAVRPFRARARRRRLVLLYGHKLGGNLLALYRRLASGEDGFEVAFVTMDPEYHRALSGSGVSSVLATSPRAVRALSAAGAIVTDHGLHALLPLLFLSDIRFFDAWHAIPFKGFDANDFRVQHRYDETWVASPLLAGIYRDQYGFEPSRIVVTGYARTDRLVHAEGEDPDAIRRRLGLPADAGKLVLFAPTWKQDSSDRSLFPFGIPRDEFCRALSDAAVRLGATVILRTHLNSGHDGLGGADFPRLMNLPFSEWPDTEELLLVTDVLVCDWSSIAFDYLLLDRPAIFLDVPPPFRKGFTLGPEYRFGDIVAGMDGLIRAIERHVPAPGGYRADFGALARGIRDSVYGEYADGGATNRCVERLGFCAPPDRRAGR